MCKKCKCQKKCPCVPCVPVKAAKPPIVEVIKATVTAQVSGAFTATAGQVFSSGKLGSGLNSVASVTAGNNNYF